MALILSIGWQAWLASEEKEMNELKEYGVLEWKIDDKEELGLLILNNEIIFVVNQEMMNKFVIMTAGMTVLLNALCDEHTKKSRAGALRQAEAIIKCQNKEGGKD